MKTREIPLKPRSPRCGDDECRDARECMDPKECPARLGRWGGDTFREAYAFAKGSS